MPKTIAKPNIKPFINWVGGKRKLADKLLSYIPSDLNNYYEPFLGGGALFFAVKSLKNVFYPILITNW